jgi:hypothetical protein
MTKNVYELSSLLSSHTQTTTLAYEMVAVCGQRATTKTMHMQS